MNKDLIRGFLLAHKAPKELFDALDDNGQSVIQSELGLISEEILDEIIDEWPISPRLNTCLRSAGIYTKKQLLSLCESQLLRIPNLGRKSLNDIKKIIAPLQLAQWHESVELIPDGHGYYEYPKFSPL